MNRRFSVAQVASGCVRVLFHGANDAQKTMGVITLALVSAGILSASGKIFPSPPFSVVVAAAVGDRIRNLRGRMADHTDAWDAVIRLEPVDGFCAQTMAAVVIQGATQLALPVSTTHVVSGAVMGAGATRRLGAVRWGVARNILVAWVLTIPATAAMAALCALFVGAL